MASASERWEASSKEAANPSTSTSSPMISVTTGFPYKVDKPNTRPEDILYMVYDLFIELNANEYQLEFPVVYASGKAGFARKELTDENIEVWKTLYGNRTFST